MDARPAIDRGRWRARAYDRHRLFQGNGRTGRIINTLYLVAKDLLNIPVLYLSRYVIRTKSECYRLLQQTRDTGVWEPSNLYMLQGGGADRPADHLDHRPLMHDKEASARLHQVDKERHSPASSSLPG